MEQKVNTYHAGPMGSGKSTALLSVVRQLDQEGESYVVFKPAIDVRAPGFFARGIPPEILATIPCVAIASLGQVRQELKKNGVQYLLFDELQMLNEDEAAGNSLRLLLPHWHELGVVAVIAAGLDVAANNQEFPMYRQAVDLGFVVMHHTAQCAFTVGGVACGAPAQYSQMCSISDDCKPYRQEGLPLILPEGSPEAKNVLYRAVCEEHFFLGKNETVPFVKA